MAQEEQLACPKRASCPHPAAGFTNGCKVRMSTSKHAAAAADGGQQQAAAQPPPQQQGAPASPAASGDAKFVKGQQVLYRTREGKWQEAKVGAPGCFVPFFAAGRGRARHT